MDNDFWMEFFETFDNKLGLTPFEFYMNTFTSTPTMLLKAMSDYLSPYKIVLLYRDGKYEVIEADKSMDECSHFFEVGTDAIDFALRLRAEKQLALGGGE